ncbi:MAG: hypothetical protein AAFV62_08635 [Pseudomonadota bacterium]
MRAVRGPAPVALFSLAAMIGMASVTETAAEPQCLEQVSRECLQHYGAGAIPSGAQHCEAQLDAYSACLRRIASDPRAQLGKDEPVEIGVLVSAIRSIAVPGDNVAMRDLVRLAGRTVAWDTENLSVDRKGRHFVEGTFSARVLDEEDVDPIGIARKIWRIRVTGGTSNADRYWIEEVTIARDFFGGDYGYGDLLDSIARYDGIARRTRCPNDIYHTEINGNSYLGFTDGGATVIETRSTGSGGYSVELGIHFQKQGARACGD